MTILTKDELNFLDMWHTPQALLEILFHNWDNLNAFDEELFGELRLYQAPMVSDETQIDFDLTASELKLSNQEKFDLRKRVGDLYCFGARKFGKSLVIVEMDLITQMLSGQVDKVALGSVDLIHIRRVLDPIKNCFENHPICSMWKRRITGSPDFKIELKTDWILNSVNYNIGSKNPGQNWYGLHVSRVYSEEASLKTEEVASKEKDALSEMGAVFRTSGMTNFTPHSPAGKTFYDQKLRKFVLNLPQYINPTFTESKRKQQEQEYGGKNSIGFRIFVDGEIVEDGISTFDMERVRKFAINEKKTVTTIEISKDRFRFFKQFIILERPVNATRMFVSIDVGEHVSEININSQVGDKYEYLYNVTLFNLTDDEQVQILKYIVTMLKANVLAIDCGDGMGRAIYRELEKTIPKENLVWYDGKMYVQIGFEKDDNDHIIFKDGKPVAKNERMAEWSVKRLKDLLYDGTLTIPEDYKFISQFGQVIGIPSGNMILYKCTAVEGDHLFDSFKIFAIAEWAKNDINKTPDINDSWGGGITTMAG
jgi:hypothetical protein